MKKRNFLMKYNYIIINISVVISFPNLQNQRNNLLLIIRLFIHARL